ncbi:hypothetical protein [Arcobacter vandammei]|uniref:hypothetical protein n=1 Tax=Arcobacter vandammei TaxID=2782243 RepID=UPI0018DFB9CE|nr:hypothetical protein [Arcobacter vandammei]
MDINQINNNSLTGLNNNSQLQLNRSNISQKVENLVSDELSLNISNITKQRSEFSSNIQSLNDGIAISKIATNAIEKQQDYLNNIQTKLENIDILDNKNDIKQNINEDLRAFNKISYETNYKKESLLVQNYYDESQDIQINTSGQNFSIPKPNVSNFANQIFESVNNSDLNNPTNVINSKQLITGISEELNNISNNFNNFSKELEAKVNDSIKEQNNNLYKNSIDFGKETTDFTKANISINAGSLIASQANIIQDQSVRLLS